MKKIFLLALSFIFLSSCGDSTDLAGLDPNYEDSNYTTESFRNYTMKWVAIQSDHPEGFKPFFGLDEVDLLVLDPGDAASIGQSYGVRNSSHLSFYVAAIDSMLPVETNLECTLRHRKVPFGEGRYLFPANIFWCNQEFGEEGPDVSMTFMDEYEAIQMNNFTDCDVFINATSIPNSNQPAFYDLHGIRGSNNFTVQEKDELSIWNYIYIQPGVAWSATIDSDCNDCTLRYRDRGNDPTMPIYHFWCVEEYGEEGPQ